MVDVALHDGDGSGVPRTVLVEQSGGGEPAAGPGADGLGVDAGWLHRHRVTCAAGSVTPVPLDTTRPDHGWLLGTGAGSPRDWRAAGAALVRAAATRAGDDADAGRRPARTVALHLPAAATAEQVGALTLGAVAGSHRYRVTNRDVPPRLGRLRLIEPADVTTEARDRHEAALRYARVLGGATGLARDLADTPADVKNPAWLAGTGARLARAQPGLAAAVRDERWLAEQGFGGVLAVGGGSARPPRLLELSWRPRGASGRDDPRLVLVGKGVTFDTGGISIKPADGMALMRTDMSGGAAVIAAMLAVAKLQLPLHVTGLVPCAENHVSGGAYRPGDVVRHVGGTTTEVANTDAEGRLLLADTLAHGARTLGRAARGPTVPGGTTLVDVATLTGAMKVSLGLRTGGLFASEPALAERIRAAGGAVGEDWWPMPLPADHAEDVRSEIADLRQAPPGPGGIVAALFLREFTGGLPWAHLDIAGPARAEQAYDEVNPGGTGFATRTLIALACSMAGYSQS
ncbi:MAG: peptidase M17 [Pseudonocardiaceae bacterium]|nr:peptidase M17 [Pseudonocardiaceae bacterium]